jgi:sirohydrochlorin cobaltochelatase
MTVNVADRRALDALDLRLKTILPKAYQDSYEQLQPVPMGSAALKYGSDGKVAWNEVWTTFCDLAMAGGPPHKGALLAPAQPDRIDAEPDRYADVVEEICRGITMATELQAKRSPRAGWVRVVCYSETMAEWLLRAIVMENVAARAEGMTVDLPAAPDFRLEKEIKNVITVIAKTSHYWLGHMPRGQRGAIADLFAEMAKAWPLIEPGSLGVRALADADDPTAAAVAEQIHRQTGLRGSGHRYAGWLGLECPTVRAAVWMMRALVVSNVLSRREGTTLFVPLNPATDPGGQTVVRTVTRVHGFATARQVVGAAFSRPSEAG